MVAWQETPTLTDADLEELLDLGRRADAAGNAIDTYEVWESATAYAVGDRVIPDPSAEANEDNTNAYICTTAGTSGASEPTWADGVTDGTVVWAEDDEGKAWIPTYDLYTAASEGWLWKAAAAANLTGFTADGATYHEEQIIAHCHAQAAKYGKGVAGSISVSSYRG